MDYCYCDQGTISIWGSHALSAVAGSVLTLLALRLKNSPCEIAAENAGEGKPRNGDGDEVKGQEDADFDPHYQPKRTARRMSTISGSFKGVDGETRKSIASLINDGSDDEIDEEDEVARAAAHFRSAAASGGPSPYVRVGNGTSDTVSSQRGSFVVNKAMRRSRAFNEHVVSKLSTPEECKLLLHRTRAVR